MELYHKKNLLHLRTQKRLSQEQLANRLGYSRNVYKNFEYSIEPDPEFLFKLSESFGINIHDFITKDLSVLDNELLKDNMQELRLASGLKILSITVNEDQSENIEFIPVKARAGYLAGYADPEYIVQQKRFSFPFKKIGTFRAFEIEGDSMPPHKKGSIIISKYLDTIADVKDGKTYVVITKEDGVVYKRLYHRKDVKDELMFISDNRDYEPYVKHAKDILEIWEYHCHISFDPNENLVFVRWKFVVNVENKMRKINDWNI